MNFNKNYPIAILDTNIVMDVPNILGILKGCNIVIPYTLIEELDNHKKENKGARDFVNNFLALSEKANLSKEGYKLENDCMLYLDMDKNNLSHKDIDLSSKKQDIKFIAEAKNIKEKYNDMTVVLLTSDKIMKITASTFDVKAKNLEEFLEEYLKVDINGLYELAEKYNYYGGYQKIFISLLENKDINGLYKLAENENIEENDKKVIYKEISEFLINDKDINGLYELAQYYYDAYNEIFTILSDNKDTEGLYKLAENENIEENDKKLIYKKVFEILSNNKDIDGLYKLSENNYYNNVCNNEIKKIKELEYIGYELDNLFLDKKPIYREILEIILSNKYDDIKELRRLADVIRKKTYISETNNINKLKRILQRELQN